MAGQKRLAELGFKQGGMPGYGLRRMLVSADRKPKQRLAFGERKSIATDRVILVPGPPDEVEHVREIYRLLTVERRTVHWIAGELTRRNISYVNGSNWDSLAVYTVLTHPKYMGCHVYGRTASRLSTPKVNRPTSAWVVTPGSYDAIVDSATFMQAQRLLCERTAKLIEYGTAERFAPCDLRRRIQAQREGLMLQLVSLFPHDLAVVRRGGRWRTRLRLRTGRYIAVVFSRTTRPWKDTIRWQVDPVSRERRFLTLLVRLDIHNRSIQDFYVIPNVNRSSRFTLKLKDAWLDRGQRLGSLEDFCDAVKRVCARSKLTQPARTA